MPTAPVSEFHQTWTVRKPTVKSAAGLVASQHHLASQVGADVLADGGNAIDAAVAAGLAIGAVEPWMSGLGGGGFMQVYVAAEQRCYTVDFGMRAPLGLDPMAYPLVDGAQDADLFGWPAVLDDRNVHGPLSIAVPGMVAGHALALSRFGTRPWAEALAPAVALARGGMAVDWYATLKIASGAKQLACYAHSAETYLPGGFVPCGEWGGPLPRLQLGRLADTLATLAADGPDSFWRGDIAASLAADLEALGSPIGRTDLDGVTASVVPALSAEYRGATVHAARGLTAGPTLHAALARLAGAVSPTAGSMPDASTYVAYADALEAAYAERLTSLGDGQAEDPGHTTHLSVVDAQGNMVSLTQTLLSVFGSKVVLPGTGILMNNGVMWFDPRPGEPNSMAPGKRPLSNMCPTIVERADGVRFAMGASGGRRIMPAVFQLLSFLVDHEMALDDAVHQPRVDSSGEPRLLMDERLPQGVRAALGHGRDAQSVPAGVYPVLFACPNVVSYAPGSSQESGTCEGGAFIMSPWSAVSGH